MSSLSKTAVARTDTECCCVTTREKKRLEVLFLPKIKMLQLSTLEYREREAGLDLFDWTG